VCNISTEHWSVVVLQKTKEIIIIAPRERKKKGFSSRQKEKRYFRPRKNKFSSSFIIGLMRAHFAVAE